MKYLQDYVQAGQTALFEELGVFFAFGDEQFKEGADKNMAKKPEGTKWSSMGAGMYLPSVNVDEFILRHDALHKVGVEMDLAENGRSKVLQRELGNYEIGLVWDGPHDENFRGAISDYGFTEDEIMAEYKKHMQEVEY